jgi:hypothetical protein
MVIDMNMARLDTIEQIRKFLFGVTGAEIRVLDGSTERLRFVERTLKRLGHAHRSRADRGMLREYLRRMSGYS